METENLLRELLYDGEIETILSYFGNITNFIKLLKKYDLFDDALTIAFEDGSDFVMAKYLQLGLSQTDPEIFNERIQYYFNDVIYENGKFYLEESNREDISEFFCTNKRDYSISTIEEILKGDYHYDSWVEDVDVYGDVVQELTPKNLEILKEYIIKESSQLEIEPDTEVLEEIANNQGKDYVIINGENIDEIIDNKETMNYLLENYLTDTNQNLKMIYNYSWDSAYESELYSSIMGSLVGDIFVDEGQYITEKIPGSENKFREIFKVELNNFRTHVIDYLDANKNYESQRDSLGYNSSYKSFFTDQLDECIDWSYSEYPDFRLVDKNINEFFPDYF